jgi:hypothetical protein
VCEPSFEQMVLVLLPKQKDKYKSKLNPERKII